MENNTMTTELNEVAKTTPETIPTTPEQIVPLNCEAALAKYSEEERKEILKLADSIDVREIDKVMQYGGPALKSTFQQCGDFLKDERGSQADQEVIKQVIQLSKKAKETYDDFNLTLKEPNLLQKLILSITSHGKDNHTKQVQQSAITNYKLLMELRASCNSWIDILKKSMGDITNSAISDVEAATLLEKYIIAGNIAKERVEKELVELQNQYQETGLQSYSNDYEIMKEGYDIFNIKMANLEKSRVMYKLSIGQLSLIKRSNRNVQISIHTQIDNSMTLMGQQLRNAVINAKTKEVLEGQKAVTRLNDELMKEVSKTVGLTAEESEKLLYAGFYNVDAAREAITTVISSCEAIQKTAEEMLPKMKAETEQLNQLMDELKPHIERLETLDFTKAISSNDDAKPSKDLKF